MHLNETQFIFLVFCRFVKTRTVEVVVIPRLRDVYVVMRERSNYSY